MKPKQIVVKYQCPHCDGYVVPHWDTCKSCNSPLLPIEDKAICEHPFKRLHWVDTTVFCNKCKTTLIKTN